MDNRAMAVLAARIAAMEAMLIGLASVAPGDWRAAATAEAERLSAVSLGLEIPDEATKVHEALQELFARAQSAAS